MQMFASSSLLKVEPHSPAFASQKRRRSLLAMCFLTAGVLLGQHVSLARNEVQTITLSDVTAATIKITHPDYTGVVSVAPGASAAQVQAALEAKFGAGTVTVSGSSAVGRNLAPTAVVTGRATIVKILNNGVTNDNSVFVRTAAGLTWVRKCYSRTFELLS